MDHTVTVLEGLRRLPSSTRAELAESCGLSVPTVSRAVARLMRDGLAEETISRAAAVGRPPRTVRLRPAAACVLGVDAGGRHLRAVLADLQGTVLAAATREVGGLDEHRLTEVIADLARETMRAAPSGRLIAAAVGISGIVEAQTGRILLSPDLPGLPGVPVRERLGDVLGVPVAIDNDDLLAAVAEAATGAAVGCRDVVFLSLGYGLGAGIIVGGRPVRGADAAAGAIAYLAPGRLAERASGRAIPLRYQELMAAIGERARAIGSPEHTTGNVARPDAGGELDAAAIFGRAAAGETVAARVVAEVVDALGELVVNIAAILDPEVIVLGGGLARTGPVLFSPLADRLATSVPYPPRLVASTLAEQAVAQGAALLAFSVAKQHLAARYGSSTVVPEPARVGALELV
jgi:predicted NBD/HSP70 family sugar kinase